MIKGKLQNNTRITTLLKSFNSDVKKKTNVFTREELEKFIKECSNEPCWLVRKVRIILSYFGGLRQTEAMDVKVTWS